MRPLNGANAELTGRVSREAARGVMAEVSAGNYTLSRRILAGLVGERGLNHRWRGLPPSTVDLTARDTRLGPSKPLNSSPTEIEGPRHICACNRAHTRYIIVHPHAPSVHTAFTQLTHMRAHPLCSPHNSTPCAHTLFHGHTLVAHTHTCMH